MAAVGLLQLSHGLGICRHYRESNQFKKCILARGQVHLLSSSLSSNASRQDAWSFRLLDQIHRPIHIIPSNYNVTTCRSFFMPCRASAIPIFRAAALALTRSYSDLNGITVVLQLAPAVGIIAFAVWGLGPLMRYTRNVFLHRNDNNWKKSGTYYVFTSYLQPLLLWTGVTLVCRVLDPVILPSEASQAVKQRLLNFVLSLSTVLAFAYCLSSLIQQAQKFFIETNDSNDTRNMGFQFAGKAMYTAVWVAAVSLFMELLGFSTQKWITAGGLGTVLLTLAGREIFTNFLSSVMIHATRSFVVNEWIQTKIEGYEVSGTVEHVGWWSPTIIRGDDREAVHIPNHKFTVNVVRNLSQKTHWRIKTHLAISHLDANKINNIVADMRKVLAKNPQVEQQRLHRRVFLDNINPENQALLTSRFEEYLCVKEAILLDLLRVISHHRARLATPIRTVQKYYGNSNTENIPFGETTFNSANNRPFLLIEPSYKVYGEDKSKARSPRVNGVQDSKAGLPESKPPNAGLDGSSQNGLENKQPKKPNSGDTRQKRAKANGSATNPATSPPPPPQSLAKPQLEGLDSMGLNSREITLLGAAFEKPPVTSLESDTKSEASPPPAAPVHAKNESERLPVSPPPVKRSALEDNIVLGVALDGAKRTLPIEEGIEAVTGPIEAKKLAGCCNGSGSSPANDKKTVSSRRFATGIREIRRGDRGQM